MPGASIASGRCSSSRARFSAAARRQLSELDQELDRLAVVHGPIAVRDFVERAGAVEDEARLDLAFEDVGQQLFDVGADRRGAAAQGDVLPERDARRSRFVFWDSDPADGAAGTGDLESGHHRLLEADALQHRVDAEAVCELAHALDRGVTAFGDDVRGAKLPAERGPLRVAAE